MIDVTNVHSSASKILENVIYLASKNMRTEIKTIVMKENANEYVEIEKYCKNHGIDYRATEGLFVMYAGSSEPRNHALNNQQLCESIEDLDCIRFGKLYHENKNENMHICCYKKDSSKCMKTQRVFIEYNFERR